MTNNNELVTRAGTYNWNGCELNTEYYTFVCDLLDAQDVLGIPQQGSYALHVLYTSHDEFVPPDAITLAKSYLSLLFGQQPQITTAQPSQHEAAL